MTVAELKQLLHGLDDGLEICMDTDQGIPPFTIILYKDNFDDGTQRVIIEKSEPMNTDRLFVGSKVIPIKIHYGSSPTDYMSNTATRIMQDDDAALLRNDPKFEQYKQDNRITAGDTYIIFYQDDSEVRTFVYSF